MKWHATEPSKSMQRKPATRKVRSGRRFHAGYGWKERVSKKAPDGTIIIDEEEVYNEWVENGNGLAMNRNVLGVVAVSRASIQISFTFRGVHCRERIKLQPTPANLKRAELARPILHAIAVGTFDYSVTFPQFAAALSVQRIGRRVTVICLRTGWKPGLDLEKGIHQVQHLGRLSQDCLQRSDSGTRTDFSE